MSKVIGFTAETKENPYIENIVTSKGFKPNYNSIKFELCNGDTFEIQSKFNSSAIIEYVITNNLEELKVMVINNEGSNSRIDLELLIETYGDAEKDCIKEPMNMMHMYKSFIGTDDVHSQINLSYINDFKEQLEKKDEVLPEDDSFYYEVGKDNKVEIILTDYPNEVITTISQAIKEAVNLCGVIKMNNHMYGIDDYNFKVWLEAHEW